jgi:hypothetical protein
MELTASMISMTRISALRTTLAVTRSRSKLRRNIMEHIASVIMMRRIGELVTTLAVTTIEQFLVTAKVLLHLVILSTLTLEAKYSSETSVLITATE